MSIFLLTIIILLSMLSFSTSSTYNILNFGAKPDGITDISKPLLAAWSKACNANVSSDILIPSGSFFLSQAAFEGPCKNNAIRIFIQGTIIAPSDIYSTVAKWILVKRVDGLTISGGILDGRGEKLWACKLAGKTCSDGATSLGIEKSRNVKITGLSSINSKLFHISIQSSNYTTVRNVKIIAPDNSPNTDGILIMSSRGVLITGSIIQTGDDCIAIKPGVQNVWIEGVTCGPGHGISIGSLGVDLIEEGVQNITVKSVVLKGSDNGLRIKTWGRPSSGFVKGVSYQQVTMRNVTNPIIIDQNYCPYNIGCPYQNSGIKISDISFNNILGTSASKVAVRFDCSKENPCTGIGLKDINLTYGTQQAGSFCMNAIGRILGIISPSSCLSSLPILP